MTKVNDDYDEKINTIKKNDILGISDKNQFLLAFCMNLIL